MSQKKGTILDLVDKTFFLSHLEFHEKNMNFIVNILIENDYLMEFIMKNEIKYLIKKTNLK